jgi:hypothetical protein
MGQYINPPGETKEAFLLKNGTPAEASWPIDNSFGLVCLLNNGSFNAAGICFDRKELEEFNDSRDDRPKRWFLVKRDLLRPYCPDERWKD